jgi:hypothetical protein
MSSALPSPPSTLAAVCHHILFFPFLNIVSQASSPSSFLHGFKVHYSFSSPNEFVSQDVWVLFHLKPRNSAGGATVEPCFSRGPPPPQTSACAGHLEQPHNHLLMHVVPLANVSQVTRPDSVPLCVINMISCGTPCSPSSQVPRPPSLGALRSLSEASL